MKNTEKKANLIIEEIKKSETDRKITLVLSKSKAEKCSPSSVEEIRQVFNTNPRVKEIFKNAINNVLRDVFPQNYYGRGEYASGEMSGVYDLEQPGRSVINKLNTNYSCFCVLLRDVNKVLLAEKSSPITFIGLNQFEQINQAGRFVNVIEEYKDRIFKPSSSTFQSLMLVLGQTHAWGQKREDTTIEILKKQFGNDNVKAVGKLGSAEDALGGVDCEVIIDGKLNTAQIKPFGYTNTNNGFITIFNSANVQQYRTNWLIFSKNNKEVLIFDNKRCEIIDGNFVFPEKNLIYTLS